MRDVEIQQIAKFEAAKAEIAQKLSSMHGKDGFDGLKLNDNQISDEKVNAVAVIDGQGFVSNGNRHLSPARHALLFDFVEQARFIGTLKQTGAERGVHPHCCTDNRRPDIVFVHSLRPPRNPQRPLR